MKHFSVAYRGFLVTGALMVVVAVAVLSTASRTPYFNIHSAGWRVTKASRMNQCRRLEAVRVQATSASSPPEWQSPVEASYPICKKELLPNLPWVSQTYHFRSPPIA